MKLKERHLFLDTLEFQVMSLDAGFQDVLLDTKNSPEPPDFQASPTGES